MRFSQVYHPDGLNDTLLSQDCILEDDYHCGDSTESIYSKHRSGGEKPLICLGPG